jgi:hypothetical protein
MWNANRRFNNVHPSTSHITISAHIRDLQQTMHPERSKPPRRPLAWIRKSR